LIADDLVISVKVLDGVEEVPPSKGGVNSGF